MNKGVIMKTRQNILVALAFLSFAGVAWAQGGRSYVINHFVSDPNVIESHLVITDVEGLAPTVYLKFYDNDGNLIGQGKERVQPFNKLNLNPGRFVNNKVVNGTVHLESEGGNIVAEYWQFYKDPRETWKNTTTIGFEAPGFSKLACPHFVSDKDVEAYLVFASSDGKDATITINFYDDAGRTLGTTQQVVKGNGKLILKPMDFVKKQATGVAYISASGGKITGEYWQAQAGKDYQIATPMGGI